MMKSTGFLLLCCLTALAAEAPAPARITFYVEKSDGNHVIKDFTALANKNRDFVPAGAWFQLFLDGKHFAKLHTNRFVTIELPAGRHEIRTKRSARMQLDLTAGEHIFVRPGLYNCWKCVLKQESILEVPYRDVSADIGNVLPAPVKSKDIYWGEIVPETSFPSTGDTEGR